MRISGRRSCGVSSDLISVTSAFHQVGTRKTQAGLSGIYVGRRIIHDGLTIGHTNFSSRLQAAQLTHNTGNLGLGDVVLVLRDGDGGQDTDQYRKSVV